MKRQLPYLVISLIVLLSLFAIPQSVNAQTGKRGNIESNGRAEAEARAKADRERQEAADRAERERERQEAKERADRERREAEEREERERERREAKERADRERREAEEREERERERREAQERAERERREAQERADRERREAQERADRERREAAARAEREREERAERAAAEKAERDRRAAEVRAQQERAEAKQAADRAAAEKAERDRKAAEVRAQQERAEAKQASDRAAAEKAEHDRKAAEIRAQQERAEAKQAADRAAAEKAERDRKAAEVRAQQERAEAKQASDRAAAEKAEHDRKAAEIRAQQERAAIEMAEERAAAIQAERDRKAELEKLISTPKPQATPKPRPQTVITTPKPESTPNPRPQTVITTPKPESTPNPRPQTVITTPKPRPQTVITTPNTQPKPGTIQTETPQTTVSSNTGEPAGKPKPNFNLVSEEQITPKPKPAQTIQGASNLNSQTSLPPQQGTPDRGGSNATLTGNNSGTPPITIPFPPKPADNMSDPVNLEDLGSIQTSPPTPPVPPVAISGTNSADPEYGFPNPVVYTQDYGSDDPGYDCYVDVYNVYEDLEVYYFEDNWNDYNYRYTYSNDLIQLYDYLTYIDTRYQYNTAVCWDWYNFYASHYYYQYGQLETQNNWEMSIEDFLSYKRDLIRNILPELPGNGNLLNDSVWVDTTFGLAFGGYEYYQAVLDFDPDNVYAQLEWAQEANPGGRMRQDIDALNWLFKTYGNSEFVNLLHWKVGKDLDSAIIAENKELGKDYLFNAYYLATSVLLVEPNRNDFAELLGRIVMTFRWYGIRLDGPATR